MNTEGIQYEGDLANSKRVLEAIEALPNPFVHVEDETAEMVDPKDLNASLENITLPDGNTLTDVVKITPKFNDSVSIVELPNDGEESVRYLVEQEVMLFNYEANTYALQIIR